eukprot:scaffold2013_cov182-Alexandrium_tamarense.AAC.1
MKRILPVAGVSCGVAGVAGVAEFRVEWLRLICGRRCIERYELGESPPRLDIRNVARESRRRQKDRKSSFHSLKSSIIDDFLPTV